MYATVRSKVNPQQTKARIRAFFRRHGIDAEELHQLMGAQFTYFPDNGDTVVKSGLIQSGTWTLHDNEDGGVLRLYVTEDSIKALVPIANAPGQWNAVYNGSVRATGTVTIVPRR